MKKFSMFFCIPILSVLLLSSCGNPCKKGHTFEDMYFDTSHHWEVCTICGATSESLAHAFTDWETTDEGHYQSCHNCQYTTEGSPHICENFESDDVEHYQICDICQLEINREYHTYGDWHVDDDGHYKICNICNKKTVTESHQYERWLSSDNGHYQSCSICEKNTEAEPHNYQEYQFDENGHWQSCLICKQSTNVNYHIFDTWQIDETEHAHICSTCSYTDMATNHSYGAYHGNESQHWQSCECGNKINVATHTLKDYQYNNNEHWKNCSVCDIIVTKTSHKYAQGTKSCTVCPFDKITDFNYPTGTITTKYTEIETEHFIFKIDANVYVVNDLKECAEKVYNILEKVSGLSFSNPIYGKDKIEVEVIRSTSGSTGESEKGNASASTSRRHIQLSPGDLFIGNSYAFIHELSHILEFSQSRWYYGKMLVEGFAEYTTYKALSYIHNNDPNFEVRFECSYKCLKNMQLPNQTLYSQSIIYWMENGFPYGHNNDYGVGFRMMWYLDETYGNYTKWINAYEKINPFYSAVDDSNNISLTQQINALTSSYGSSVLDQFYPWLKSHEAYFDYKSSNYPWDLRNVSKMNLYPLFAYSFNIVKIYDNDIKYCNLYINLGETKKYLSEYKHKNINNLQIVMSSAVSINLYDKNGNLIKTCNDKTIALTSNVCYIRLNGEGYLRSFEITGY